MRRFLIAGNWKMHMVREDGLALVDEILAGAKPMADDLDFLIAPPYTLLSSVAERLGGSRIALGAQDLHWEASGAFTSGISAAMLRDVGCTSVLVGHSERRDHFGDTGEILARKLRAALGAGLAPIFCVGEHLEEREAGRTNTLLKRQCDEVLAGLSPGETSRVTLAYEPVWAIGTGKTATPEIAQETHVFLRGLIAAEFGEATAGELRILYGGSVKPENAADLLAQPDIDGALIGGACLKGASFLGIARAALG